MKKDLAFRIIDVLVILILGFLIIRGNVHLHKVFGGSFFFIALIAISIYFSYCFKRFQLELSYFSAICVLFLCINYLAYLESTKALQLPYIMCIFVILAILIGVLFLILSFSPIKFHAEDSSNVVMFKKSIFYLYSIPYILGALVYCLPIAIVFYGGIRRNSGLIHFGVLEYSLIALYLLILSHLILFRYLKKINEKQLESVIEDRETVDVFRHKNKLIMGAISFFIFGSALEAYRGLWLFWVGTIVLFLLIIINGWKTWIHRLSNEMYSASDMESYDIMNIIQDFKFFVFNVSVASVLCIALAILIGIYGNI